MVCENLGGERFGRKSLGRKVWCENLGRKFGTNREIVKAVIALVNHKFADSPK